MNEKKNFDYKRLHPFKWYILENFPFLEDSIDVLTNYQLFCKLGEMYNKEIDAINTLGVQVEGITDWFDNLDVQEEVDKKLDEMVEDGELQTLLQNYASISKVYNTCEEMIADLTLVNNSKCKTLGYSQINDYGDGEYIITDTLPINKYYVTLNNGLYAILIHNGEVNAETLGINHLNDLNTLYQYFEKINFNKDYSLTQSLEVDNITLDFKGHTINGNVNLIYSIIAGENTTILNAKQYFQTVNTDYCNFIEFTGSNFKVENCEINGFIGITCSQNDTIENIVIRKNKFNCKRFQMLLHTGTFNNIIIEENEQTEPQTWTTPTTAEMCFCICNGFKWVPSANEITANILNTKYGNNYYINNNKFNQINARAFDIINAINVKIENNYCYNLPGDKATVGISDDVFVLEFCKYSNISYNKVENSGENAIDLLSCQYCNCNNNELINCDGFTIDLNNSDMYTRGWCDNTVTAEYLESSYNNIVDNIILIRQVGIAIRNGRNNIIKNNNFKLESTHVDNVATYLTKSNPFTSDIGTYGNTVIDNNFDNSVIRNFFSEAGIYINSNIVLGENDHIQKYIDINNTELANNDSVKMYDVVFNLKAKNAKFYYIYNNKKYYFEPLMVQNTSLNAPFGISNVQFFDYRIYLYTYKHFLPLQQSNRNADFYNVTSGRLYIELW